MNCEFSRPISIEKITNKGMKQSIKATDEECRQLAERYGVLGISNVCADLSITKEKDQKTFHIQGTAKASMIQESVISGDEVTTKINSEIDAWYRIDSNVASFDTEKKRREQDIETECAEKEMPDEKEAPELVTDGVIDLGEIVSQFISLSIPDFPKTKDEENRSGDYIEKTEEDLKANPFAVLKDIKTKE